MPDPTHQRRLLSAVLLAATGALLAWRILPAERSLTGDAPLLLARSRRIYAELLTAPLDALSHLVGQVVPQPPVGHLVAGLGYGLGLTDAAPLFAGWLALCGVWWGMGKLSGGAVVAPLLAWLLLIASPMTWSAVEHLEWDLLCAGWLAVSLGALAASDGLRRRPALVGVLAGLGALVKYSLVLFYLLPAIVVFVGALRAGRKQDAVRYVLGGLAPLLVWVPLVADSFMPYLSASLASPEQPLDSASAVPSFADRLSWSHLSYYPAVLKDALGWPGVVACLAAPLAARDRFGRLALLCAVGGLIALSLIGRREPRYLLPLLPMLLLCAGMGLRRLRGWPVLVLVAGLAGSWQLRVTATVWTDWNDPRPLRTLDFGPDNLTRWGNWPRPERPFIPSSSLAARWSVPEAVDAIIAADPGAAVGFVLYANPRVPVADLFVMEAADRGLRWDSIDIDVLSAGRAPEAPRRVDGSALRHDGHGAPPPLDEGYLFEADIGPFPDGVRDFSLLYTVHPQNEPFHTGFTTQLGAEPIATFSLPRGFVGVLWQMSEAWSGELGQELYSSTQP
ncbi:MAG: hypothetical protein ACI8RZ_005800 [Myxococcota bacterium]|jgi:hypothetical protein